MNEMKGYESLAGVLQRALDQAQSGKGAERHADGKSFDQQPMQRLCELYGVGFALGQAGKKMQESQRMTHAAAVRELLGAIVYIAGAVVHMERQQMRPADVVELRFELANDNAVQCKLFEEKPACQECRGAGRCMGVERLKGERNG